LEGVRLLMGLPEGTYRERQLPAYLNFVQRLGPQIDTLIATGCPLLDIADMASGRGDAALVLGIEEQDLLVGSLLLKESGALLGSAEGAPSVTAGGNLLAASPRLYKEVVKVLKAA
jgi:myo-inositol-1(or 4)-monophosphatase